MKKKNQPNKFDIATFNFLYDNVLVRALRDDEIKVTDKGGNEFGLVRPEQRDEKPEFGIIVAIGNGRLLDDGTVVAPKVKVGDTIFFGKYSSEQTHSNGQDYFIIREEDIKAVK